MIRFPMALASLSVTAVSFTVAGCSTTQYSGGGARRRTPVLAVRLANYGQYEAGAWAHLQSIGAKYVFMSVPAPDKVDAAQKLLADHGLTVVVMRGDTDLSKGTAVEELATQLGTCRKMGVKYMFLSAKLRGAPRGVVCERLRKAGDAAAREGVTIVLETHPELGTNGDLHVETMQAINHPNVRVNFDTGNITYYNRDTTAAAELKKCIAYVATFEVKDHNAQFETWNFPPLGKGALDIPGVLAILKQHGYEGPITIEVEGIKGMDRSEAQIHKDIEESVAYMRQVWPW